MKNAQERQKLAWEGLTYGDRRIDLLLISISGAGIYVCLETIKYLSDESLETHWLIWASGITFLLTIVINFIGQFVGKKANEFDFLMCQAEIDASDPPTHKDLTDIQNYDNKADKVNRWINPINYCCTFLMIIGLSSILLYFLLIF